MIRDGCHDASDYYFISYSRKDYYFAEALSYGLGRRGINVWIDAINLKPGGNWERQLNAAVEQSNGIILVGSQSAYDSVNVQKELALGRSLNKPLYIAKSKWHRIPSVLDYATVCYFSPDFTRGLVSLDRQLSSPGAESASRKPLRWLQGLFPLEWDVMAFAILFGMSWLMVPFIALNILLKQSIGSEDIRLGVTVVFNLLIFFRPWAKRTMGWIRLNLILLLALVGSLVSVFLGFVDIPLTDVGEWVFSRAIQNPVLWGLAIYIVWLFYLMYVKKSDQILRWLPTGSAPEFLRAKAYGAGSPPPAGMSPKFSDLHSYFIHNDPSEAGLAEKLREILDAKGGASAPHPGTAESHYMILTGNTKVDFVEQAMLSCGGNLYPVISTGIKLNRQLDWLWQLQWIDFRKWVIKEPRGGLTLPVVPEALTAISLPRPIIICYLSILGCLALSSALGAGFMGYGLLLFGLIVWVFGISLGYLLLNRLINAQSFLLVARVSIAPFVLLAALYLHEELTGYRIVCFLLFCVGYVIFRAYSKAASSYLPCVVRFTGTLRGPVVTLGPLRDYFILSFLLGLIGWFK